MATGRQRRYQQPRSEAKTMAEPRKFLGLVFNKKALKRWLFFAAHGTY